MKIRRQARNRKAVSSVIGAVIVLAIFLTVGYGYFYTVTQNDQLLIKAGLQSSENVIQQDQEYMTVTGTLVGPLVGFSMNNTGESSTILSYFVKDSSTNQTYYNSGSSSNPSLPYAIGQGKSIGFATNILYTPGHTYTIKLLTQRGSTFVGTYPPKQLSTNVVSALIAAGIGSISMVFSSYDLYNLTGSGNNWNIGVSSPRSAGLIPYDIVPAFSIQITNNDPSVGTITLDSHTELYLYHTCPGGCGGNVPVFAYFIVNVGSGGGITSTNQGSFVPITIPYGVTQTLYFASANDLSVGSFASLQIAGNGNKVGLGEYDVFVIIAGSDSLASSSILYSQNLPFAGSYLADNVAWLSETPTTCTHSSPTTFTLSVTNSYLSTYGISQVSVNASGLSSISGNSVKDWTLNPSTGTPITWSANGVSHLIKPGYSLAFTWSGTPPSKVGTQTIFTITITFYGGTVISQQSAAGCLTD